MRLDRRVEKSIPIDSIRNYKVSTMAEEERNLVTMIKKIKYLGEKYTS